jgi:hypothetical protein
VLRFEPPELGGRELAGRSPEQRRSVPILADRSAATRRRRIGAVGSSGAQPCSCQYVYALRNPSIARLKVAGLRSPPVSSIHARTAAPSRLARSASAPSAWRKRRSVAAYCSRVRRDSARLIDAR